MIARAYQDQGSGIRDQGSGIRDQGSGIRNQESGIRDQGSEEVSGAERRGRRQNHAPQHPHGGEAAGNFFCLLTSVS
ncbi:MAG: hypothetical protein LBI62_01380 [Candidatus Accumulibacter sp.]|nr:hypothetical protein [Accumulibacter sp.]